MNVLDRFLRYVRVDTQSDPHSPTQPSTRKQMDLGRMLVEELHALGVADAELDPHGYVYATLPATPGQEGRPVICFCSHMDTSPDASGTNVKPIVHRNYQGQDLVLPDDKKVVLRADDLEGLRANIGHDIVTASGTTLLGADNKAGIAAIMAAVEHLLAHPEIPHGKIRILFTPDEEIGRGVNAVDMDKLGADFGYTIDGETRGSMEDETFSADAATVTIAGVSAHPGFAKGKLENAVKIAADIVAALPKRGLSPETTSDREGFIHPVEITGKAESAQIDFILRDFETDQLADHAAVLESILADVRQRYPNSFIHLEVTEQYRNMKEVLDHHPRVTALAEAAIQSVGLTPRRAHIRGGTDGSRLSFMGLPCPNLFAGEHAFHSRYEWASVYEMQKSAEVIVAISHLNTTEV
ncbi:tripeptide aminopeptidase [Lewinella marina]|uniref:Peptidase T n=1 Tax=Neolewinella marina TaxID=438751 RepID=A0A2G0CJN4_9BACT|nr:peptidase T [Neolewinella marina]NJB84636.1 tripeptide aminopeptidase [Neolewinella marina]PHL00190.1 peptidase T [Neolewinella marina]